MVNIKTQQLYSNTPGAKPSADLVEVGQLWINLADNVLGTKTQDGTIVSFAQLSEEEKETLLSGGGVYIPKQGLASEVTVSMQANAVEGTIVTIDDSSDTTISASLTAEGLSIDVNKTTGHKATKLVISKAASITGTITWNGVDSWLSTLDEPVFGESEEAQELCVAIFTSPSHTAVNVVYNTENPTELDVSGVNWGDIAGTLADQTDLANALAAKADASALSNYAPLANPSFTGTATLGGQTIATVNQIPDISDLATKTELAGYLPLTGGTATGSITAPTFIGNLTGTASEATHAASADSATNATNATTAAACTGNAATATKLADARTISLTGLATGSVAFDGSADAAMNVTAVNDASKVALTGSRGTLAGYEAMTVSGSALTVNQDSPDSQQLTAAAAITVSNGTANTAWVKKVSIKNASATISLDTSWSWVGGSQPTVTAPSLLVLSWDNNCGMAILNTV